MKIQNLAVIFIIIILPISMVLTVYVQNQVKTLELQIEYDDKLTNATYDALKAFQLNTANSSTSDLANSKLRDIEASVNTFFNSISSHFNMAGYNQDILKEYVPALVYTMYDGYYIYSPYTNTLSSEDEGIEYTNEEKISGLKPYIYYSCRYVKGDINVIISYTLDNYITIQGTIGDEPVNKSGYLINNCEGNGTDYARYRNIDIGTENLREDIIVNENGTAVKKNLAYTQVNGVKYYQDTDGTWFSVLNDEKIVQSDQDIVNNSAVKYYTEAAKFKQFIIDNDLDELSTSDAKDAQGNSLADRFGNYLIFQFEDNGVEIEEANSNFNQHRLAVIRYSIEKNLSIAIANYNNYSDSTTANFQMPTLQEDEWEKIINNVSIISFLQGLSIGGKVYNGYSIVTNTKNKEVVSEDSIYITTADGQYHRVQDSNLEGSTILETGIFNMDFERKSLLTETGTYYYYPKTHLGCYNCITSKTSINETNNIYDYLTDDDTYGNRTTLAELYFTALGRERYGMYRTNNAVSVYTGGNSGSPSYDTIGPHALGDVNDDGVINLQDYNLIIYIDSNSYTPTEDERLRADVNQDGIVDYNDSVALSPYLT